MSDLARRWRIGFVVGMCVLCAATSARLQAQPGAGTATLAGTVFDPDGKVIVEAALVIRNETSGDVRTSTTDGNGRFSIPGLPTGSYTIEVGVPGFELVRRTGVQVTTDKPEEISIRLSVANIAETVTVSAALPAAALNPHQAASCADPPRIDLWPIAICEKVAAVLVGVLALTALNHDVKTHSAFPAVGV